MPNWKKIKRWSKFALEAAPAVVALSRHSHPVAWFAAGAHILHKAWDLGATKASLPSRPWKGLHSIQSRSLVDFLVSSRIGDPSEEDGKIIFTCHGLTYGMSEDGGLYGPFENSSSDPQAVLEELWAQTPAISLSETQGVVVLSPAPIREVFEPSNRIKVLAENCKALHARGKKVGLLIDGPPGSGKSESLLYIAKCLGGKILKASFNNLSPYDLIAFAYVMKPHAVILDDIDRGQTDRVLYAVDMMGQLGVAILASSNDSQHICRALLREGRIDEHFYLGVVEPDVLERFSDRLDPEEMANLSRHTVATIQRYLDIKECLGKENALSYLSRREAFNQEGATSLLSK